MLLDMLGGIGVEPPKHECELSRAFELLTGEPGVTVSRNGDSFLRIEAEKESISAVNAMLVSKEIKVYELSAAQETLEEAFLRLTKTGVVPPNL